MHFVDYRWCRSDNVQIIFPFQTFLDDLKMEKTQKSASEAKAQSSRCLRLINQRRIVQLKPLQCIPQILVIRTVRREHPAVNHGIDFFIPGECLITGFIVIRDRIAHAGMAHVLYGCRKVADHSGTQFIAGHICAGTEISRFNHIVNGPRCHHLHLSPRPDAPVLQPDKYDNSLVGIINGIKNKCFKGSLRVAFRRRDLFNYGFKHLFYVYIVFCGDQRRILSFKAYHVLDLFYDSLRFRTGQVYLVDDRHDLQVVVYRHVNVGQRLRLDALSRIHHKDRPLAGRKTPRDLVIKVNMARGVYQVEHIFLTVLSIINNPHGLRLDGDAPFPFKVHIVKDLCLHLTACKKACSFDYAVRKSGLPVINVGYDTEISDVFLIDICH